MLIITLKKFLHSTVYSEGPLLEVSLHSNAMMNLAMAMD